MVKTTTQEKVKNVFDQIAAAIENINTDADWLKYLEFNSKFYNYSARNILLIYMQKPDASFVKGFKAWHELERYVKKGAKGIAILAPCIKKVKANKGTDKSNEQANKDEDEQKRLVGFTVKYVFDISDTDGNDEDIPVLVKGLSGNSEQEKSLYEHLKDIVSQAHQVQEVEGIGAKGYYNIKSGDIAVRSDLEYRQKIKTLLHEYGHALDYQMNPAEDISKNYRELIAESVAYVVSNRLGIDTSSYSTGYIRSWLKDKSELKQIADTVQKISLDIITKLEPSTNHEQ